MQNSHKNQVSPNSLKKIADLKDAVDKTIQEMMQSGKSGNIDIKISKLKTGEEIKSLSLTTDEKITTITIHEEDNIQIISQSIVQKPIERKKRIEKAKELKKQGKTQSDIARIFGVSQKTISCDLRTNNDT